jgi:antitoxin component of RelBE/YafQ-DinJ toxin-antitoxin module
MNTPRQTFRISEQEWKEFQRVCKEKGYNASEVIRHFIKEIIEGKIAVRTFMPKEALEMEDAKRKALKEWLKSPRED